MAVLEVREPFDELLRSQNRSVSFITGTDLVNIDLCNEPSSKDLRNKDKPFGDTVCYMRRDNPWGLNIL